MITSILLATMIFAICLALTFRSDPTKELSNMSAGSFGLRA